MSDDLQMNINCFLINWIVALFTMKHLKIEMHIRLCNKHVYHHKVVSRRRGIRYIVYRLTLKSPRGLTSIGAHVQRTIILSRRILDNKFILL